MEKEITWLSHGGPGSGRYPKGSGEHPKGEIKRLNRLSRGYTRANYHRYKNENKSNSQSAKAIKFQNLGISYNSKKAKALKKKMKYDLKVSEMKNVMESDAKQINEIKAKINNKMGIPLKTVKRSTVVDGYAVPLGPFIIGRITTSKYDKYKINKKALKNK